MAEDSADTPRSSHRAIEYNHGSHQLKNRPKSIKPTNCDMPTNFYHPNNLPISRALAARYRGRQRLSQETRFHLLSTVSSVFIQFVLELATCPAAASRAVGGFLQLAIVSEYYGA
ncbi:hypothetical protein PCANC_00560 [Puccinia coronata f. sp. avenae]|uniref:Uncharacterized protein n=1 Tax=Puccinia coronata f. sp. avenae TaxID=200324 RepID=A0A2N5W836_9BASI|nr:hypothetical protein PCANC_00560 [Puccinia coronata f. sp. avenae]